MAGLPAAVRSGLLRVVRLLVVLAHRLYCVGIVPGGCNVEESHQGRATSVITTISYLGFLLGPVYVGSWAAATGLRGAMTAVAALAAALFLLTSPLLGLSRSTGKGTRHPRPRDIKSRRH
ncbi:hypothetical protein [Streptomyces sp. YIM S03343]